jgi:hypothetical protein
MKESGPEEKDIKKEAAEKLEKIGKEIRAEAMRTRGDKGDEEDGKATLSKRKRSLAESLDSYLSMKNESENKRLALEEKVKMKELELAEREQKLKYFQMTGKWPDENW